jgi:hypothetical protein
MTVGATGTPYIPMCKLAEYMVTASSVRRRSLVKDQIKNSLEDSRKHRWWYQEARAEIRKFFRNPSSARSHLSAASNRLRDIAAEEQKESKQASLLASARAVEAFSPIAELVKARDVVASAGKRDDAHMRRGNVKIVVAPDILFLERGSEHIVGALKLHASQEFKLNGEALLNAASILFAYLQESGEKPIRRYCTVVDVLTPSFETAPSAIRRRMQAVQAACEEIDGWWNAMYSSIRLEVESGLRKKRD